MRMILIIAALVAALGAVGAMDYNDELAEQEYKCDMVKSGAWPESVLDGVECK
ncbi:MAG: hypothetical protein ACPHUL_00375 [Marinomonas gallaica]